MNPSPQTMAASLRNRAAWHRRQAADFLNNSTASMAQHDRDAAELERQARAIDQRLAAQPFDARQADEAAAFSLMPYAIDARRDTTLSLF